MTPDVLVYDATLRLGVQGTGFHPSIGDALAVLRRLEELGVGYAEIGEPAANPRDATLFARAARELTLTPTLVAHATLPLTDDGLRALLASGARTVALSATASAPWVTQVLGTALTDHVTVTAQTISRLQAEGLTVVLDAEHAVDGLTADPAFTHDLCGAGADLLTVCDTLGGALPWQVADAVTALAGTAPVIGIQCHDDGGCATANTLAAVRAGARLVQVTVNGYGNRCGVADLAATVAGIETKLGLRALPLGRLASLQRVAHAVAEIANVPPDPAQPYVGAQAFAHRTGPAAAAVTGAPSLAQHVDPAAVGNAMTLLVAAAAGRAGVELKARALGIEVPPDMAARVVDVIRRGEATGLSYEAAEASFELLLRAEVEGLAPRVFDLESWRVIVERRADGELVSEATVKLFTGGRRVVATGEGNGPVNALDTAIRTALGDSHPALAQLELVDYKVRILDGGHGTGAVTRVLITTGDGEREWVTVGAGENVIDASWQALDDAVSYGLALPRS
jgi:2-isopropylmalate synthase